MKKRRLSFAFHDKEQEDLYQQGKEELEGPILIVRNPPLRQLLTE